MLFAVDGNNNSVRINNGLSENSRALELKLATVCDGKYTDYEISFPDSSMISRGKQKLKNNGKPFVIRVFTEK